MAQVLNQPAQSDQVVKNLWAESILTEDGRVSTYKQDPLTSELLKRNILIANHKELHDEARGFLTEPFKLALGKEGTEKLGMHHYTVHLKMGIAHEYFNELETKLDDQNF